VKFVCHSYCYCSSCLLFVICCCLLLFGDCCLDWFGLGWIG